MNKFLQIVSKASKVWNVVFFLVCLFTAFSFATVSVFSVFLKSQGDKAYQNKNYNLALERYRTAKKYWLAERINFKFKYDDLETKTKKAEIMVRSNQNYLDGMKEFGLEKFDLAKSFFLKVVENDPNYSEAKNKISIIEEKVVADAIKVTKKKTLAIVKQISTPPSVVRPILSYADQHCPKIIKAEIEDNIGRVSGSSVTKEFKRGDISQLTIRITATDPQGLPLHYQYLFDDLNSGSVVDWTTDNIVKINITNPYLGIRGAWVRVDNQDEYGCIGAYYDTQTHFSFSVTP